jgi:hypothetical protein
MEKDTAGCRVFNRNYIVGGIINDEKAFEYTIN